MARDQRNQHCRLLGCSLGQTVQGNTPTVRRQGARWFEMEQRHASYPAVADEVQYQLREAEGQDIEHKDSERVDVGFGYITLRGEGAHHLLRGVPGTRARGQWYTLRHVLGQDGDVEVDDLGDEGALGVVPPKNEDIVRLDVAMDDARLVQAGQAAGNAEAQVKLDAEAQVKLDAECE